MPFVETTGKKANKKSGNGEHCGCDNEKIRRSNLPDVILGNIGPENRTESAADGDESVQAFALFNREKIGHESPEDSSVKKVEHADPNKETATNPYLLWRGTTSHCDKKEHEHDDEESVSKRNEFSPRHSRHSRGEGRIRSQHRDEGRGEHPRQRFHVACPNAVTDWLGDVIAGQD